MAESKSAAEQRSAEKQEQRELERFLDHAVRNPEL